MTSQPLRISGKDLGDLARPQICPRCIWIKLRFRNRLPYQIFPGIFSSIDSYTKKIVHHWFDDHQAFPPWLSVLGELSGYIDPPHFSKFCIDDSTYNIKLTGAADGIYRRPDGSLVIVDYKTAKFTDGQDVMLPVYRTQLNAYTLIAEQIGLGAVSSLALIYMEPCTEAEHARLAEHRHDTGFGMKFCATVKEITIDRQSIAPLLARSREIFNLPRAPERKPECKDCLFMDELVKVLCG